MDVWQIFCFWFIVVLNCLLQVLTAGGQIRPGMTVIRTPVQQAGALGKTILRTPLVVQQGAPRPLAYLLLLIRCHCKCCLCLHACVFLCKCIRSSHTVAPNHLSSPPRSGWAAAGHPDHPWPGCHHDGSRRQPGYHGYGPAGSQPSSTRTNCHRHPATSTGPVQTDPHPALPASPGQCLR